MVNLQTRVHELYAMKLIKHVVLWWKLWSLNINFSYRTLSQYICEDSNHQNNALGVQCPGRFWGIIGQDPCVSKSNQLHVETLLVLFLFFILVYFFIFLFEVYST